MNIARTTLSSKLLTQHKDHFAKLAVEAILRLKGSGNLEAIQLIKKLGGAMDDSYLEEGERQRRKGTKSNVFLCTCRVCVSFTLYNLHVLILHVLVLPPSWLLPQR